MLTRNSADGLRRSLPELAAFREVIIADGFSTDSTRAIARQHSFRVIDQPTAALDRDGALVDYSAARNAAIDATSQPWILMLDSDERLSEALVEEVAIRLEHVSESTDAFELPFRYVIRGREIDTATTYPGYQIRLFRNHLRYERPIHEAVPVETTRVERLRSFYYRYPPPITTLVRRWIRYGATESRAFSDLGSWWRQLGRLRLRRVKWLLGAYRRMPSVRGGTPMPLRYELTRPLIELSLIPIDAIRVSTRPITRRIVH